MARQKSIIKIKGKIDDLSFYESKDGFIVRKKGGIDKGRIAKDPKFLRTRENNQEFSEIAWAVKLVKDAVRPLMLNTADGRASARLSRIMTEIKNADGVSVRGERNVAAALSQANIAEVLKGFDFNKDAPLASKFYKVYNLDPSTGVITIGNLIPQQHIIAPEGASHLEIKAGWARIDFGTGKSELRESNVVNVPLNSVVSNVSLSPASPPVGQGTDLFLLKLVFYQEVNGVQYHLSSGAFNVLNIIGAV